MPFGEFPVTAREVVTRRIITFSDEEQQSLASNQARYSNYRQTLRAIGTPAALEDVAQASWYSKFLSYYRQAGDADEYAYVASMFCPKPDPLGRYALVNIHAGLTADNAVEWSTYLYLAGAKNYGPSVRRRGGANTGICLGIGYTHDKEIAVAEGKPEVWMRGHSIDGVSYKAVPGDSGPGLGFVLYCGGALISRLFYGATGCYSTPDAICRNFRSSDAEAFWRRQVERGFAKKVRNLKWTGPCGRASYGDPPITRMADKPTFTAETINADDVLKSGLVVFMVQPHNSPAQDMNTPVGANQTPSFSKSAVDSFDTYPGTPGEAAMELYSEQMRDTNLGVAGDDRGENVEALGRKYGIYFKDGRATYPLPQRGIRQTAARRLEMLKRVYHGESPALTFFVMETLALADKTAAVDYATRPDIARGIANDERAKAFLQRLQQRRVRGMGGLSGLSDYELGEIGQAVTYAGAGRMPIDPQATNPLNLPPLPAAMRKELEQYGD